MASIEAEQFSSLETSVDNSHASELAYVMDSMGAFMQQHEKLHGVSNRAPLSLSLANELRTGLGQKTDLLQDQDLLPLQLKVQIDAIEWLAWNDLWYYHDAKTMEVQDAPAPKNIRKEEFIARERLLEDIESYDGLSIGRERQAYDNLITSLYLARLVVKNPQGFLGQEKNVDKVALNQMLAEHRLIKALHSSGFSRTRRPVMSEKDKKIDAVIPLGKYDKWSMPLRVQPGSQRVNELRTQTADNYLFIDMPYDTGNSNPFAMTEKDKTTLISGVNAMRCRILAKFTLQTGVDGVQLAA